MAYYSKRDENKASRATVSAVLPSSTWTGVILGLGLWASELILIAGYFIIVPRAPS